MPAKKTSPETIAKIVEELALGTKWETIAERLHVSTKTISKVATKEKVIAHNDQTNEEAGAIIATPTNWRETAPRSPVFESKEAEIEAIFPGRKIMISPTEDAVLSAVFRGYISKYSGPQYKDRKAAAQALAKSMGVNLQ